MYLSRLKIENFRLFGSCDEDRHLDLELSQGLNLLVGENDSGKSCIVDALRMLLGTLPEEYYPITPEDFHSREGDRRNSLVIVGEFSGLSEAEAAAFLEYLEVEDGIDSSKYKLRVELSARIVESSSATSRRNPVKWERRAGPGDEPSRFDGPSRNLLRATYLKPLRDAVSELAAKKGSRLSQILQSYQQLQGQEVDDWNPENPNSTPTTLIEIIRKAEHDIRTSDVIDAAESNLNSDYLERFSIGPQPLKGRIGMPAQDLRQLLERMELTLADQDPGFRRGLGHHNLLFMAAELLALKRDNDPCLPLILIEEPEAHLHPQLQIRLLDFFRTEADGRETGGLQVLLTSHSPNIASAVPLSCIVMMSEGRAFPLGPAHTKLDQSDYEFLERFLDVTRAELLFARGLLIVEGDAEAIALPTIADLLGWPLAERGVSVVNVGSIGLFRYSRILQRNDGHDIPVRVACLADRDIPPTEAKELVTAGRDTAGDLTDEQVGDIVTALKASDGGPVQTFVSESWTFEYDLALAGLGREMHAAVTLATKAKNRRRALKPDEFRSVLASALKEHRGWIMNGDSSKQIAIRVYKPLLKKNASKAETAQQFARILRRYSCKAKFDLESKLPTYVLDALKYTTRRDEPEEAAEDNDATRDQ